MDSLSWGLFILSLMLIDTGTRINVDIVCYKEALRSSYGGNRGVRSKEDIDIVSIALQRRGRTYNRCKHYSWLVISQNQLEVCKA